MVVVLASHCFLSLLVGESRWQDLVFCQNNEKGEPLERASLLFFLVCCTLFIGRGDVAKKAGDDVTNEGILSFDDCRCSYLWTPVLRRTYDSHNVAVVVICWW